MVEAITFLQRLGFADVLLWLLTFAIVYGVLSQVKIPKSKEAQAIISIVVGFLVLLSAPTTLITFLSQVTSSLVLVGLGLLILVIFLEVAGLTITAPEVKGGKATGKMLEIPFLSRHPVIVSIVFVLIAVMIFLGAGGLNLLGLKIPYGIDITGVMFFVVLLIAILWMVFSREGEK